MMRGRTLVSVPLALGGTLGHFSLGLFHNVLVHRLRGLRHLGLTRLHARLKDPPVDLVVDLGRIAAQVYGFAFGGFRALRGGALLGLGRRLNGEPLGLLLLEGEAFGCDFFRCGRGR
jgi:hypothetical protein